MARPGTALSLNVPDRGIDRPRPLRYAEFGRRGVVQLRIAQHG